jgi:hypothetical protein
VHRNSISTLKLLDSVACELHLLAQILGIKVALKNHTNESNPFTNFEGLHHQSTTLQKSNEDGVILQTAPNIKIPWLQGYINQEVEDFIMQQSNNIGDTLM